jgi:hypothetical protein
VLYPGPSAIPLHRNSVGWISSEAPTFEELDDALASQRTASDVDSDQHLFPKIGQQGLLVILDGTW